MILFIKVILGIAAAIAVAIVGFCFAECREEINQDLKVLDKKEHDLHVRHLAKTNEKRVK